MTFVGSSDNQALLKVSNRKLDKRRRSSPGIQRSFSEDCRHDGDPTQLVDSLGRVYTADPIARTHLRSSDRSLGGRQRRGSQGEKDGKPSTTEVPVRLRAMSWDVSVSAPLAQENEMRRVSDIGEASGVVIGVVVVVVVDDDDDDVVVVVDDDDVVVVDDDDDDDDDDEEEEEEEEEMKEEGGGDDDDLGTMMTMVTELKDSQKV